LHLKATRHHTQQPHRFNERSHYGGFMKQYVMGILALSLTACPGAIGKAVRKWGYNELRPASTMMVPGTLVWVINKAPFTVGRICDAAQVLGPDYHPVESMTMNGDISRINKKGVTLDVNVADIVNSNNDLHDVNSIKMTLNNVHIMEVSDYDIEHYRFMASPSCRRAAARRQKAGYTVTMISSALQADVVGSVNWDKGSKLSVDAKVAAVANLSAKLGVEASAVSDEKIEGKGLFWGIRDDEYLAYTFIDPVMQPPVSRDTRVFPKDFVLGDIPPAAGGVKATASDATNDSQPARPRRGAPGSDPNALPKTLTWDTPDGTVVYQATDLLPPPEYTLHPAEDDQDADLIGFSLADDTAP
jgi:hypothetical protein